jgi:hypothetical protein
MTLAPELESAFRNARRAGWLSVTVVLILAVAFGDLQRRIETGSAPTPPVRLKPDTTYCSAC